MYDMDKCNQLCSELRAAADQLEKLMVADAPDEDKTQAIEELLDTVIEEAGDYVASMEGEEEAKLDAIRRKAAGLPEESPEPEEEAEPEPEPEEE